MNNENFINLVKRNTCFIGKGSRIDLILTNRRYSFKHTSSTEKGLSDHHQLISSMMNTTFEKEKSQKLSINIFTTYESDVVELLGLTIDKELKFSKHIDKLCRNAQYKLHALRQIRKYLSLEKAKTLGNAFIDSQFNYAP